MYDQALLDAVSPGYKGQMKVLSSLVLEELYPLLAAPAVRPTSLWPLARLHPREVYVGHTVPSQESWWEWNRIDQVSMMKWMKDPEGMKKQMQDVMRNASGREKEMIDYIALASKP